MKSDIIIFSNLMKKVNQDEFNVLTEIINHTNCLENEIDKLKELLKELSSCYIIREFSPSNDATFISCIHCDEGYWDYDYDGYKEYQINHDASCPMNKVNVLFSKEIKE